MNSLSIFMNFDGAGPGRHLNSIDFYVKKMK
jgi:hypothetical protein